MTTERTRQLDVNPVETPGRPYTGRRIFSDASDGGKLKVIDKDGLVVDIEGGAVDPPTIASGVGLDDADDVFVADNVEDALNELRRPLYARCQATTAVNVGGLGPFGLTYLKFLRTFDETQGSDRLQVSPSIASFSFDQFGLVERTIDIAISRLIVPLGTKVKLQWSLDNHTASGARSFWASTGPIDGFIDLSASLDVLFGTPGGGESTGGGIQLVLALFYDALDNALDPSSIDFTDPNMSNSVTVAERGVHV